MRMRTISVVSAVALGVAAARGGAQQVQVGLQGAYQRTTQSHQSSSGVSASYGLTFGGEQPVLLNTGAELGYMAQHRTGQQQLATVFSAALQLGGGGTVSPYVGGDVSANWTSGGGEPSSGAQLGLEYIVGAQVKLVPDGSVVLRAEVRPGYVRTQEHHVGAQVGFAVAQ